MCNMKMHFLMAMALFKIWVICIVLHAKGYVIIFLELFLF